MSYDLNHVAIIGNIGKKEHHTQVVNGNGELKALFFKIAYSTKIRNTDPKTKDTQKYEMVEAVVDGKTIQVPDRKTEWIPIVAYGTLAQFLSSPTGLQDGLKVCVEGRVAMHKPEKATHPQTQIVARNVNILGKRSFPNNGSTY